MTTLVAVHVGLVLVALLIFVAGLFLPKARSAQRVVEYTAVPEEIWKIVTDIERQARWRTDLRSVAVLERTEEQEVWTEYPKTGAPLIFKTKKKRPFERFETVIARTTAFNGRRVVELKDLDIDTTRVTVTESVEMKNPFTRVLAHLSFDFSKKIDCYVQDLGAELKRKQERLESQTS